MAQINTKVTALGEKKSRLPGWFSEFAILLGRPENKARRGVWEKELVLDRGSGYNGIDVLLVLVAYFVSGECCGLKRFLEKTAPYGKELAAVGGRRRWSTQSSLSRALNAVTEEQAYEATKLLLRRGADEAAVEKHESALYRDTREEAWHIFHFDHKVKALRVRALSEGGDLPSGARRSDDLAAPGYAGRKRGEVQISRATLQHAGSGLWHDIRVEAGNASMEDGLGQAIATVGTWADRNEIPRERCVICVDGESGGWPQVGVGSKSDVCFLTRLSVPGLLDRREVCEELADAKWEEVLDSGSGPRRYATEAGTLVRESLGADVRLVVSRFKTRDGKKRGAGKVIDGWQYEVFATCVPKESWPASEIVTLYYGRCGQENRFAGENRELGLTRIFAYALAPQCLANAVGLWVWNQRIICGAEMDGGLAACDHRPSPRSVSEHSMPPPHAKRLGTKEEPKGREPGTSRETATATEGKDGGRSHSSESPPPVSKDDVKSYLDANWHDHVDEQSGWRWSADKGVGLCPENKPMRLHSVVSLENGRLRVRLRRTSGLCDTCPVRSKCSSSTSRGFLKEVTLTLSTETVIRHRNRETAEAVEDGNTVSKTACYSWKEPDRTLVPGSSDVRPPMLLPAKLRHRFVRLCEQSTVVVEIPDCVPEPKIPYYLAPTPAARQHRRKTNTDRLNWNALRKEMTVTLSAEVPPALEGLFGKPSPSGVDDQHPVITDS